MLDHLGLTVADVARSKAFYLRVLAPLSISLLIDATEDSGGHAGFGAQGKPFFWIGGSDRKAGPVHVAFTAPSRRAVDAFHRAGLAAGGTDNGQPGLRPLYHPNYYGAFLIDPDGNNVEAVCHTPELD